MRHAVLFAMVAALAMVAVGCSGEGEKSATEKEFQGLYKTYSTRFHEKMVGTAENMKPVQVTAEAARIWDETFASHPALIDKRVAEILKNLDDATPVDKELYVEIASGSRVDPTEDQPKGIILKQFLWSPVGAAQMGLNNWLARLLQPKSFGVRSVLTANAGLFWEVVDRNISKPKLQLRQGPMIYAVDLSRIDDYYQVDQVRWLRPKAMGPVAMPATTGDTSTQGTALDPKIGQSPVERPVETPAPTPPAEKPKR